MTTQPSSLRWLLIGDILASLVVTWIGFLTHYGNLQGLRWLTTFVPVVAAWFAVSPWLGVYRRDLACQPAQVWRPALAAALSAPLAATLRGLLIGGAISPVFVVVMALTNALGFLVWRFVWSWAMQRMDRHG